MILVCLAFKLLVGSNGSVDSGKSFGFRRNLLPARTFPSRSGRRHILDKCTSRRIASKTMHGDCTITAIYHHPVFQRGLYVRHELVEKVLQTLRLRPATVSPTANGSALTPITWHSIGQYSRAEDLNSGRPSLLNCSCKCIGKLHDMEQASRPLLRPKW